MFRKLMAMLFGTFVSRVPGHEGDCYPVWINRNEVCRRLDGPAISGFFKNLNGGPEFHGVVWTDGLVWSTDGVYTEFRGPDATISKLWCTCVYDPGCPKCHGEGETRMTVRERSLRSPAV